TDVLVCRPKVGPTKVRCVSDLEELHPSSSYRTPPNPPVTVYCARDSTVDELETKVFLYTKEVLESGSRLFVY
ncbi:hypothetical protein CPC08DRAFT_701816, partial [Agrocybe pediades]